MKYCHFILVLWALINVSIIQIYSSCFPEEMRALLDFKASMNETRYPDLILPSWIDDHHDHEEQGYDNDGPITTDCCNWEGVKCSDATGRIVELHLSDLAKNISDNNYDRNWFLNLSILLPLENLQALELSDNYFHNSLSFKDLKLPHLEVLNLGNSGIHKLRNLQFNSMQDLSSIEVMTSLKALSLRDNRINDSSILEGICSLKNLLELDLSWNNFSGNIPLCLSNLTSLRALDITRNNFSGNIPSLVITSLVHLEYLSLSNNHFEGSFSLTSFANHSKLQQFYLEPLGGKLYVKTEGLDFLPSFQLTDLQLAGCNLNNETGKVLRFLLNQKKLTFLDLSSNNLVGKFPNWLLENNTRLELLILRNNSFTGPFLSDATPKQPHLWLLDISNNDVGGQVPQDIGLFFPSLKWLNLSGNSFEGSIPESLGNLTSAFIFDLSHNNFFGEVPDGIGIGCIRLWALLLSNNSLRGYFPSSSTNLTNLNRLHMDNNHFSGSISHGLSRSLSLYSLDISNNEFQGEIPRWIGNLSSLEYLDLSGNQLEGTTPDDICRLSRLEFLDLSGNCLNGSIPSCSGFPSLIFIHLQRNQITGSIPNALLENSTSLRALDLRYNRISGGFPRDIRTPTQLRVLLLGGNNLHDEIPASICQLKELSIMDLSWNNFSGPIPSCISYISFGANFNNDSWTFGAYSFVLTNPWYPTALGIVQDILHPSVSETYEIVQFTTKDIAYPYTGDILNYMSGIDLSHNQLTGKIPPELGDLSHIRALNLSHNYLEGSIPSKFSMLNLIESLDLSYNNLSGQMPLELTNLNFLSKFNVSYNNLLGRVPDKRQFANFDESNYKENPNLCGPLLQRQCESNTSTVDPAHGVGGEDNDGADYMVEFFLSFSVSFVVALLTLALTLYLNPQYRRAWSHFIDTWILSRFYRLYKSRSR